MAFDSGRQRPSGSSRTGIRPLGFFVARKLGGAGSAAIDVVLEPFVGPPELREQEASLVGVTRRSVVVKAKHALVSTSAVAPGPNPVHS